MHRGVTDHVLIKIDADIEGARRKIAALKKEAGAGPHIRTERRTGEKHDASGLGILGSALLLGGGAAQKIPAPQAKLAGTAAILFGGGLAFAAEMIREMEKLEIKTRTLNEVLETYRRNLATIAEMGQKAEGPRTTGHGDVVDPGALLQRQEAAKSENDAVVSGLAETWERLARVWDRMKRSGGGSVYPARAQEILDDIQAVEKALAEISAIDNGAGAERALSRVRDFLARTAAPSAPSIDGLGQPRTDDSIRPRFLGPTSGLGGSPGVRQLASLGADDADAMGGLAAAARRAARGCGAGFHRADPGGGALRGAGWAAGHAARGDQ